MPKHHLLPFLFLFFTLAAHAQSARVSGKIADTAEQKNLSHGSVLLLRQTDSIMIRNTRTNPSGEFQLDKVPAGQFLLLITYPGYADYVDQVSLKDSQSLLLPPIGMILKSKLLEEAVVYHKKGAIQMKGDTTEFTADSFKTQANASVEDLLKKLPGIQVDKNGKITAQGETVKKVLVDGEEFFGDDPTLVTQNLRADMVDKVQLYDKKSEQSDFTGIDDGQRDKTINLKLKENKKRGAFGRISAGEATNGYYDYQLMANYFRNKEKFAAYGIISNVGKTGLNWSDRDNYGQSFASNISSDGNGNFIYEGPQSQNELDSWSGNYEGQGLPDAKTGGLHYNNKWNEDLQTLNMNYKYMDLHVNTTNTTNTENILPDTLYYTNQRSTSKDRIIRNSADGSIETKFDSTSSLKLMADGGIDHKTTWNNTYQESLASDSSLVNTNTRTTTTTGDNKELNSNLIWKKKLPKKGRTISANFRENYSDNTSSGFLNSDTRYYSGGAVASDSLIDQFKQYHTDHLLLDSKVTYTEPLTKTTYLVGNYGVSYNNSHSYRNSYNLDGTGKYSMLDSLYSNNYQYSNFTQTGGLSYMLSTKKWRMNLGGSVGFSNYNQRDLRADTSTKRSFVNWYPASALTYNFTDHKRLSFWYSGWTQQPSVEQLQPLRTNENPLAIVIGNPGLKPEFSNRLQFRFNDYKVLTDRGIWLSAGYNFTQNAFGSSTLVDSGKQVSQTINVNGNYTLNLNADYNFKWKKPDIHISFNAYGSQSANVGFIQDIRNVTKSNSLTLGTGLYKSVEKKYEASLNFNASYTYSKSDINTSVPTKYWSYSINPSLDIFLPWKFQLHGDGNISLYEKSPAFPGRKNIVILNAWFGKKLLKNDALLMKVSGNDLLNQNVGFNRQVNSNYITQSSYSTIKQYFMFSVVWNFTKTNMTAAK